MTRRDETHALITSARGARRELTIHAVAIGLGLVLLLGAWAFAEYKNISGDYLTREPQIVLQGKLYAGVLSNIGAVLWTLAAAVAFIGFLVADEPGERRLLLVASVLGTVLLVDDFFLFHDALSEVGDRLEEIWIAGYLVAMLWFIATSWRTMGAVTLLGVVATVGLLGVSAGLDQVLNDLPQLIEDGFKLLGIITWLTTWTLHVRPWALQHAPAG